LPENQRRHRTFHIQKDIQKDVLEIESIRKMPEGAADTRAHLLMPYINHSKNESTDSTKENLCLE